MNETQTPKVLTIDLAETVRPAVGIDGGSYGLRAADEFSIAEFHKLGRLGRRLDALMALETALTDAQQQEVSTVLDTICQQVLDAPPEVHAKLRDLHRLRICRTFTALQGESLEPVGATTTGAA